MANQKINTEHLEALKNAIVDAILAKGAELGFNEPGCDQMEAIQTSLVALGFAFISGCTVVGSNPLSVLMKITEAYVFVYQGDDEGNNE